MTNHTLAITDIIEKMKKTFLFLTVLLLAIFMMKSEAAAAKHATAPYQLRVASYQDLDAAKEKAILLKKSGEEAYVEKIIGRQKEVQYRVNIGRFKDREEAEKAGRKLKENGVLGTFTVKKTGNADLVDVSSDVRAEAQQKNSPERLKKTDVMAVPSLKSEIKADLKKAEALGSVNAANGLKSPIQAPAEQQLEKPAVPDKTAPVTLPASQTTSVRREEQPIVKAFPIGIPFGSAIADYNAGHYEEALAKLQDANKPNLDPTSKERVLRYMADCNYFIGMRGNNRNLLNAVDGYKELMQKYPNAQDENVEALYRLAKSYVQLKFFYEAKREFQKLSTQYPNSPRQHEALFMAGDMAYRTRNYSEAVTRFKEYLSHFPQGEYAQKVYFGIGDSFSQMQQSDQAELWYVEAQRRWTLDTISRDSILNLGYHYFRSRKYPDAVRVFFLFVNLYPDDDVTREALFSIARSFMEIDQHAISVKMFSLLIDRYPDSREARESAVIMANIGVKAPGLKIPDIPGIQNYRDPLKVYNAMLVQAGMGEMTEGLLFQKGYALWKYGRYEEAFESFSSMVRLFPQGRYKDEGVKNLILNINQLVEKYGSQGDYLAVARIFVKTPIEILMRDEDRRVLFSVGDALRRIGLLFDAKKVFESLLKSPPAGTDTNSVLFALADIENKRGRYDEAERILQEIIVPKSRPNRKLLAGIQALRGDIYARKGLYSKAVSAYSEALSSGEELDDMAVLYRNYGHALKETNACSSAVVSYDKAVALYLKAGKGPPFYAEDVLITSYQGMGECYQRENKHQEAAMMYKKSIVGPPERRESLWAMYDMGRSYVNSNNQEMANKVFQDLKSKGGEEFWSNVIDYTVKEKAWTEKYAKYLR